MLFLLVLNPVLGVFKIYLKRVPRLLEAKKTVLGRLLVRLLLPFPVPFLPLLLPLGFRRLFC